MAKILLIEDNEFMVRMFENIFTLENFQTIVATSGKEGIAKAQTEQPDLILLDIIMPEMNGLQVLEKLKMDPQTKNIPVAMLTALGEEDIIDKSFKLGAVGYLTKPSLNPDQIITEVKNILSQHKKTTLEKILSKK